MTTLPYLLTASLYLLLFYGCYGLLLRRNTFFGLNRLYLLISVVLSLVLPLVQLPVETASSLPVGTITLPDFSVGTSNPAEPHGLTPAQWLWLLYGVGVVILFSRLGLNLRAVFRLIHSGTAERKTDYTLIRLPNNASPSFSFGRYLVLNQTDSLTEPNALIQHEAAHIRQRHTADVLFLEVVQAFLWFNPVLWLYKRALQEVHEFLADRAAIYQTTDTEETVSDVSAQPAYARQLVAYALDVPLTALTTPFVSKSTLKQRIVMLQKPQTHRRALLGYALALPLAALLVMCTQPDKDQPAASGSTIESTQPARQANVEGEVFTVVEQQPEFQGGMAALGPYLQRNLKYPAAAQKANVQGRVFVNFIVSKTGEVSDVRILKGIGFGADEEAIRVVQSMPRWKPAMQSGKLVNVRFNLPINFELDDQDLPNPKTSLAPPPPPPVPANDASALEHVKTFTIDGKSATKEEVTALSPNAIARVNIDKAASTIAVTMK
ncbi:M56 family metallopeptidase [Spirosoma luteum]|uniref:M56 family metallopeptidase n=1 Tax=Spirosoma luteum TaxID=431553 RepID=UPI000373CD6B|nr:M56 family metallopeptidase [Spirosoma luteum]